MNQNSSSGDWLKLKMAVEVEEDDHETGLPALAADQEAIQDWLEWAATFA